MTKRLSVIIPVFNGERFIAECLDSLVIQLVDHVEVIVINDGSTDRTDEIINNRYKAEISCGRLIYRNTPNGGVSAARNHGLDMARGDYVAFVDADDTVEQNYVSALCDAMQGAPCIIEFGYRTIDQSGAVIKNASYIHRRFGSHAAKKVIDHVFSACLWYPFLRVVQRQYFNEIRFPVGVRFCEDLIAFSQIYKNAKTIRALSYALYDYRINPTGATLNIKPDYVQPLIDHYRYVINETSFANKALKINLVYAIRRCTVATTDIFGGLPKDIEHDIRLILLTPQVLFRIRPRLSIYAIFGQPIYWLKASKRRFI